MSDAGLRILITGAGSGLGAATAQGLAGEGVRLVLNYSANRDGAEATAQACRARGAQAIVVQGDVSRDDDCRRIAAAAEPLGALDALVNNAGITRHIPHGDMEALSADDFQRILAVNTMGPWQMVRACRSLLETAAKERGGAAAVVNVSSIAGINGIGSSLAYVASKGGLNAMTIALARALAPAIRVNAVCPGYIDTEWFEKGRGREAAEELRQTVRKRVALRTASSPQEIAELVCFLARPESSQMTGEVMRIDAGMHLMS